MPKCSDNTGVEMRVVLRFVVLLFLLPVSAIAGSDDWKVAKATSQVRYTTDQMSWKDLKSGDILPNHAWISTGPRGRARLVRGVESIAFQPNTMAAITTKPAGFFALRKTEIVQQAGALDLEIERRSLPHTTVQTPYLAAVVKGTIFHVSVGRSKASVSVDRGLVQVTAFASGQQANVGPRRSAIVDRKTGMKVDGAASRPSMISVTRSVAVVPAVGTTTLACQTEGLAKKKVKSWKGSPDTSENTANDRGGESGKGTNGSTNSGGGRDGSSGHGSNGNGGGNGNSSGKANNGNGSKSGKGNNT